MLNKIDKKKLIMFAVGAAIVVLTVIINLIPYTIVNARPFYMLELYFGNEYLYYFLSTLIYVPLGTILSAVLGNKTTGFFTFAFSGIAFVLDGKPEILAVSFIACLVCDFVFDRQKWNFVVKVLLTAVLITVFALGIILISDTFLDDEKALIVSVLTFIILTFATLMISGVLQKTSLLKKFDEESKDISHNYRVKSINSKLMILINIICMVLIIVFSILSIMLLYQKEEQIRDAEESVWKSVIYNAIKDDASIYADGDESAIKKEADVIRDALQSGNINVPADVVIMTNRGGTYYAQYYEVNYSFTNNQTYCVDWVKEAIIEESEGFFPAEGNSSIIVRESSKFKEGAIDAIKRILSVALILLVLMNILVEYFVRKNIVKPINQMTTEALSFAFGQDVDFTKADTFEQYSIGSTTEGAKRIHDMGDDRVEITSGDEIESLSQAMHKTMDDVEAYIRKVREKSKQLSDMQHNIIVTMADIIESRDLNTGGHIKRTAIYVGIIARKLISDGEFSDILDGDYLNDMIVAAPLHDMGKIHVPDHILNKNGRLTDEEFAVMKTHADVGKRLLEVAAQSLGDFRYLVIAKQMAESHHEWWDGNGYPEKIAGEDIPLCARIMAVADVFDALVSKRCYKEPMDLDVAFGIIEKETGTHFDPVVGKAFLDSRSEVEAALASISE